ncbi:response regulator [Hymenobacter lutimineralis]|uniref:Sensory/regulatory protein RpfC n=1 Tax=Hymenobacter lutimineralis TaxID=2606448 RepID=A0A5D6V4K0_9BACT|nr:ATP-binding protein [Hymenobacter lutimineralis]TYZ10941.1 response regulator [Hymenobacter lutimineralis]
MAAPVFSSPSLPATLDGAQQRIRELEQQLLESSAATATAQTRLHLLINQLQEGVALLDEAGTLLLINDQACQLWGMPLPASQWVGHSSRAIQQRFRKAVAHPEAFAERLHQLLVDRQPAYNELVELKDGRLLERDFLPMQEAPGAPEHLLVCLRDVTERQRLHQQLQSIASIPGQNPNPILRVDLHGELIYTNQSADSLYAALCPEEQQQLLAAARQIAAAALAEGTEQKMDLAIARGHFASFVVPLPESGFANIYLVNITARVQAEQAMLRAKEEAEAAVKARENFLANMSHEIRTPMNGVLGMAAQLSKTQLDSRQREWLGIIRSSGQHLLTIINDVLDMAKITSGKLEMEQTPFNLCDSFAQALQPLIHQATEKGLVVAGTPLRNSCSYPWVLGDPYRLNQILLNLVSNAIKFTEPGGRIIVIAREVASTDTSLTVEVTVEDTGIGIDAAQQERIFEGFTQAYADTTRRFGGTGLGLSISRALVEQYGGKLRLQSEVGRGSTFSFTLTLPRAHAAPAPVAPVAFDSGILRGRRALLFEDNEINREVARLLLEEWGMHVDEAENGLIGLDLYRQRAYDIVLMDIQMPGMSGLEATAAIRQLPDAAKANVPILALTANAFRADNEQYLAAGMNACLTKPFEEEKLYQQLKQLLEKAAPPAAYNLEKLRALAHGREAFVIKIIRSFLANIPASLAQLEAAATAGNWEQVASLVHHIKPNLEALGIPDVAEVVSQLEQPETALQAEPSRLVARLVAKLQRALQELPRELPAA